MEDKARHTHTHPKLRLRYKMEKERRQKTSIKFATKIQLHQITPDEIVEFHFFYFPFPSNHHKRLANEPEWKRERERSEFCGHDSTECTGLDMMSLFVLFRLRSTFSLFVCACGCMFCFCFFLDFLGSLRVCITIIPFSKFTKSIFIEGNTCESKCKSDSHEHERKHASWSGKKTNSNEGNQR